MTENTLNKIIAENISKQLEIHNKTQSDLAEHMNVSQATVSNWCKGIKVPRMSKIDMICDYFSISRSELMNTSSHSSSIEPFSPGRYRIPIVGRIAAGLPIYNGGEIEGYIDYDKDPGKHVFALRIHGHSMEPRIMSGDLVIIDEEAGWEDGDIVAVTVNGDDGTCKRIKRYSDSIALIPINPDFDPQVYSSKQIQDLPVTVVGKVIELRARF